MNAVTSHISVGKRGKVSRVYFISAAWEVSVPKTALIPASAPMLFLAPLETGLQTPLGVPQHLPAPSTVKIRAVPKLAGWSIPWGQ